MPYWAFDVVALVLPLLALTAGARPGRTAGAAAVLAVVALVWTVPWDGHLVREGVWTHGEGRVLAVVADVPVEEWAFVVLQVALVAAWGARTGLLPGRLHPPHGRRSRGAAGWLGATAAGLALAAAGGPLTYLGLLLAWVGPPLALQQALCGDLLRPRRAARALLALPVALWLCAADRLALADGIWRISPDLSTGVLLAGLPLEEALFFLLSSLLVADGLLLATDPRALARARALLLRTPVATVAP
ncbi:MAG TPA: lycopene cyclase domain-containing protein [Mycobacteriales bacterium]|nr:lycopene cyclase domain-containing protein [Mycobacteriales bacterium]